MDNLSSEVNKINSYLEQYDLIYSNRSNEQLDTLSKIKRYLERFTGDEEFRNSVLSGQIDLLESAQDIGCDINIQTLLPIFHPNYTQYRTKEKIKDWPLAELWNEYISEQIILRDKLRDAADTNGVNPNFDTWRHRQISRVSLDLTISSSGIVHAPVAFELSSGCSVGCWFCGISADKFRGHFSLKNSGKTELLNIFNSVKLVLGTGLKASFLYWATEPLDNPEYVEILDLYKEVSGVYPQTTTAIPLKNLKITKEMMARWEKEKSYVNRFSILNTSVLRKVHQTFTPRELLGVELVMQNIGTDGASKTKAGKALKTFNETNPNDKKLSSFDFGNGTIACVSGFLINLVEKTIRLVSPCMPSRRWPDGYIVYKTAHYTSPESIIEIMNDMISTYMQRNVSPKMKLSFSDNFSYKESEDGHCIYSSSGKIESKAIGCFAPYLGQGVMTAVDIVKSAVMDNKSPFSTVAAVEKAWQSGIIDQVL